VANMDDPRMTKFKAMSLDEQEKIIEQSAQGALRSRKERMVEVEKFPQVAEEVAEILQVTLVQDISSPKSQDAWERVLLMMENV
jgi:hypothetical protein